MKITRARGIAAALAVAVLAGVLVSWASETPRKGSSGGAGPDYTYSQNFDTIVSYPFGLVSGIFDWDPYFNGNVTREPSGFVTPDYASGIASSSDGFHARLGVFPNSTFFTAYYQSDFANNPSNIAPYLYLQGGNTGLGNPGNGVRAVALDPRNSNVWVTNLATSYNTDTPYAVFEYKATTLTACTPGVACNLSPDCNLNGPATNLSVPAGDVLDSSGNLYVANFGNSTITVYSAASLTSTCSGPPAANVAPVATIGGGATGLNAPGRPAIGPGPALYVPNYSGNSVTVYPLSANGNVGFTARIFGGSTGLSSPTEVAFDDLGNVYVSNSGNNSITEYAALGAGTGTLNPTPIATISGPDTGLNNPAGVAVDSSNNIYATNLNTNEVTIYPQFSDGDTQPSFAVNPGGAAIAGGSTDLAEPAGITVDAVGDIFVANVGGAGLGSITEFAGPFGGLYGSPSPFGGAPANSQCTPGGGGNHENGPPSPAGCIGPFTFWGTGVTPTPALPPSGVVDSLDIYLDTAWASTHPNYRFDWDSALLDSSGNFLEDFVFAVGTGTGLASDPCGHPSTAHYTISLGNGSPNVPENPPPAGTTPSTPQCIASSGWYTFHHAFQPGIAATCGAGALEADFSIVNSIGTTVASWVECSPGVAAPLYSDAGFNLYGWFPNQEINNLAIDNTSLAPLTGPTITINAPSGNYIQGANVTANYTCTSPANPVSTCSGTAASGSPISTSTQGTFSFTVTSCDNHGNCSTKTSSYTIAPPPTPPWIPPPTAVPTPASAIAPRALSFSAAPMGAVSTAQKVTVTNTSNVAMQVYGITSSSEAFAQTDNCVGTIAAHKSCTINVVFSPTGVGKQTATLTVGDNVGDPVQHPQTVALTGVGAAAAEEVFVVPGELSFASEKTGATSGAQTVTLANRQNVALKISGITTSGPFKATSRCGSTLAAHWSCTIAVTFAPANSGEQSGTLTIANNATANPLEVALSGSVPAPTPTPKPKATPTPQPK